MNTLKKYIPYKFQFMLTHLKQSLRLKGFSRKTFSADGEDLILEKQIFGGKNTGFYVDVGSLHPKYVSNTYKLYKRGWSGINIDPNPTTQKLFKYYRSRDINLNIGVAMKEDLLTYYEFEFQGLNSFDADYAQFRVNEKGNKIMKKSKVKCFPLEKILSEHLPSGTEIDLLDVDVEGFDLSVLKSNDWNKFKPRVILVEDRDFREKMESSDIFQFLKKQGYKFYSYYNITLIMTIN
jgi:FkbM family methyltransferase